MMKRLLTVLVLCTAQWSWAQTTHDVANIVRAELLTEKSVLMTGAMELTDAQSEKFWPIYREYENELNKITDKRLAAIKSYAENYASMTNDKADDLVEDLFDLEEDRSDLREKYYKKMKKALDSVTAARFVQVDRQIATLVDMEIMEMMPLIAAPEALGIMPVQ
jgi:metal-dependent HD superfamily phosphatase/phosphodiesterase